MTDTGYTITDYKVYYLDSLKYPISQGLEMYGGVLYSMALNMNNIAMADGV